MRRLRWWMWVFVALASTSCHERLTSNSPVSCKNAAGKLYNIWSDFVQCDVKQCRDGVHISIRQAVDKCIAEFPLEEPK